jgi:hypothetical protein
MNGWRSQSTSPGAEPPPHESAPASTHPEKGNAHTSNGAGKVISAGFVDSSHLYVPAPRGPKDHGGSFAAHETPSFPGTGKTTVSGRLNGTRNLLFLGTRDAF